MLSFAGGEILHGGDPLLYGIRYILAVFLFLEKGDDNDNETERNDYEKEKTGREEKTDMEREREDEKVEEKTIANSHKCDRNKNTDKKVEVEEEEGKSNIFIKSFLSCYKSDPHFILNPIKNKDYESKTKIVIDNSITKNSVYHTETSQSTFSFGFDFIE